MAFEKIDVPSSGSKIEVNKDGSLNVPNFPVYTTTGIFIKKDIYVCNPL